MKRGTIIIADVGECWNGNKLQAMKLIKSASDAGCDYVKFQTLDRDTVRGDDPERGWFLKVALSDEMIDFLIKYAEEQGIKSLFTPANIKKAKLLKEKFHLREVKIASSVAFDKKVVKYIAKNFKTVFLSTGMSSLRQVYSCVKYFDQKMTTLYILHCISEYPTGPLLKKKGLAALAEKDAHLNMMLILKDVFPGIKVGYSDHTAGLLASLYAVAAGAVVIEKHITLDRKKPLGVFKSRKGYLGTDHVLSLEPGELKEMVGSIRKIEEIFGEYRWQRTEGEKMLKGFLVNRF